MKLYNVVGVGICGVGASRVGVDVGVFVIIGTGGGVVFIVVFALVPCC